MMSDQPDRPLPDFLQRDSDGVGLNEYALEARRRARERPFTHEDLLAQASRFIRGGHAYRKEFVRYADPRVQEFLRAGGYHPDQVGEPVPVVRQQPRRRKKKGR